MATQKQTLTQTTKTVKASTKPAKPSQAAQKQALKAGVKPEAKKVVQQQAASNKPHVFRIAAGTIAKIEHKDMKKAIKYHTKAGNIEATATGYKLTAKGLDNFKKRGIDGPEFQEIAAFVHGKGPIPKAWANQKATVKINENATFPSHIHWNSFVTQSMRLAFAALWAK